MSVRVKAYWAIPGKKKELAAKIKAARQIPEARERSRKNALELWANKRELMIKSILQASHIRPNIAEANLNCILEELFPSRFKYVGNGSLIIGGKCPDFADHKQKLIEFFGDYWHKGEDPQIRIKYFRQYGYECLVIWEHEMANLNILKTKLLNYAN